MKVKSPFHSNGLLFEMAMGLPDVLSSVVPVVTVRVAFVAPSAVALLMFNCPPFNTTIPPALLLFTARVKRAGVGHHEIGRTADSRPAGQRHGHSRGDVQCAGCRSTECPCS